MHSYRRKTGRIVNRPCGGGTKKQGLVPRVSFGFGSTHRYIKRNGLGNPHTRKVVFRVNQLTGRVGTRAGLRYMHYRRS